METETPPRSVEGAGEAHEAGGGGGSARCWREGGRTENCPAGSGAEEALATLAGAILVEGGGRGPAGGAQGASGQGA